MSVRPKRITTASSAKDFPVDSSGEERLSMSFFTSEVRFFPRAMRRILFALPIVAAGAMGTLEIGSAAGQEGPNLSNNSTSSTATATGLSANQGEIKQIGHWIKQLNHDAYPVRQAAAEQLLNTGMPARDPLLKVADGPEPETRAAARRLVALIDRSEFHRRLDAFARDEGSVQGLTLPGWEKFRERVGDDDASRALFVDMQRQEGALLAAVFGPSPQPLHGIWEERLVRLVQWQVTVGDRSVSPQLGTCATMLFLGSLAETDVSERGAVLVENLIQRPPIRENLQAGNYRDAIRRLVVGWIMYCPNQNEVILNRRLYMASMNQLPETLPLALEVAHAAGNYASVQPPTRAAAVLLVGQLGGAGHVQRLEPLLEDATVCSVAAPGQAATSVQIRDVALAVMLHLTGQRPADYGYVHARMQPEQMFQLPTLSIENDQQRVRALDNWRAWRREHPAGQSAAEDAELDTQERPDRIVPARTDRPGTKVPSAGQNAPR